ncbi:MAG: AarF/UbiB family protein [Proteobacteria bacterium]|nr:AarF/UbiB family protein [Pseudomonadota bacterium]
MSGVAGPSLLSLVERALILFGLIVRAAFLYLRTTLHNRGIWKSDPDRLIQHFTDFAVRFVRVATCFRGGLIKMGQMGSLRVDVVPDAVTDELAKLQDRVPAHPYHEIALQIERELGDSVRETFAEFDPEPIAAASLGQVHRARSKSGEVVAVKVLYPGIERSVAVDLAMTHLALRVFNWFSPADLLQIYREIRESLLGEMDYIREGRAAEECERNLRRDPELFRHLRIPTIRWETTTQRVLTMEYIPGVKINDRVSLDAQGVNVDDLVLWASRAFLTMMFRDGFFHCDPHPGNFIVDPEGRVGIIDFGMNKRIEPEILSAIRKNVVASVQKDADLYVESLLEVEIIRPADAPAVHELALMSFEPEYYNLTPQEMANLDFGEYFKRQRVHMKKIKSFQLPDGIVMWSRAISLLIGLASELAPGLRPLDVIGPFVLEFLQGGGPGPNQGRDAGVQKAVGLGTPLATREEEVSCGSSVGRRASR